MQSAEVDIAIISGVCSFINTDSRLNVKVKVGLNDWQDDGLFVIL